MKAITTATLRDNLERYLDDVVQRGERIVITREYADDDRGVLMIPLDHIDETEYLLSSEANREALMKSIEQGQRGEFVRVELSDLLAQEENG